MQPTLVTKITTTVGATTTNVHAAEKDADNNGQSCRYLTDSFFTSSTEKPVTDKSGINDDTDDDKMRWPPRSTPLTVNIKEEESELVFLPFAYVEAAANILTNPAVDPFGKIPEFKFSAVKVESAKTALAAE